MKNTHKTFIKLTLGLNFVIEKAKNNFFFLAHILALKAKPKDSKNMLENLL
jgi:hypothetical protein